MSRLSGLLVLLFTAGCLLHQSDAVLTKWIFTGEVYCYYQNKHDPNFLFDLDVWESDSIFNINSFFFGNFADDYLNQNVTLTETDDSRKVNYRIEAEAEGDGPGSEYELYFRIQHTCTPDFSLQTKYVDLDNSGYGQETVKIRDGTFEHKQDLDARQWRRRGDIFGRKRREQRSIENHGKNIDKLKPKKLDVCPCPWKICSYRCD